MTAAAACARATAAGQSGHRLGGLLSLLFSVHVFSQLFLPHVFIGFGVQNCPPMLGQLIFPKFICVNLVAMVHRHMLLQGLFPAVALFAERTSKLLSMNAGAAALTRTRASNMTAGPLAATAAAGLTSIEIFGAHLFLQMLFQTCLVSKFPKAIGAFEGSIIPAMCRLHMIVEEPFFREIFATGHTNKGPLTGMDPVVNVQVGLAGVGLSAYGADEGLLARMHPDVLLQAVVVIAGLLA